MSAGNGSGCGDRDLERIDRHTEAALKQVMAAGDIARAMWRIQLAARDGHRMKGPERAARRVIDTARQRNEMALHAYVMAAYSAALATTASSDRTALALMNLAAMHEHLGYVEDALRLLDITDTDRVSPRVRRALAISRAGTGSQQARRRDSGVGQGERADGRRGQ